MPDEWAAMAVLGLVVVAIGRWVEREFRSAAEDMEHHRKAIDDTIRFMEEQAVEIQKMNDAVSSALETNQPDDLHAMLTSALAGVPIEIEDDCPQVPAPVRKDAAVVLLVAMVVLPAGFVWVCLR